MTGPLKFWHVYCCHVYFFSARFLNMCKLRSTFYLLWWVCPPGLGFYGSGPARLPSWLGMVNADRLGFMQSEIFLKMKFIIFQGCPTKQAAFLPGQSAPYNQLLYSAIFPLSRILFRINCWSWCLETLSPFFSECSFHWLQHFFL